MKGIENGVANLFCFMLHHQMVPYCLQVHDGSILNRFMWLS